MMEAARSIPKGNCGCGAGASTGKMCGSPCGTDGMPAKREATEGLGGAGAETGAGTKAGEDETGGGGETTRAGAGARAEAEAEAGAKREGSKTSSPPPLTATHFHPKTGSKTLFICPKTSVRSTSKKVSCRPAGMCRNGCRGGESREPGRAQSGTGGGDRERD